MTNQRSNDRMIHRHFTRCGLVFSTTASKAPGSLIASSLSIFRFNSMPAATSAGMNRL